MLITGGSGFLGRHLTHGAASEHWEIIAPSSTSMDVRRHDSTIQTIVDWKPMVVVHLAYRKGDRPSIVEGSRAVAQAAHKCGARMIHMSTDVVFGGRMAPYTESDEPFPIIDYGRDKADAEKIVMDACPTAVMVRTSLMYGTDKMAEIQLDVQRALNASRWETPMTFFTDEYRCPVHVADVAKAITYLAGQRDITGPLHVGGPEEISRADFARRTAEWLGLDPHGLQTGTIGDSGLLRVTRVVLDSSLAKSHGITARTLDEAYRR